MGRPRYDFGVNDGTYIDAHGPTRVSTSIVNLTVLDWDPAAQQVTLNSSEESLRPQLAESRQMLGMYISQDGARTLQMGKD